MPVPPPAPRVLVSAAGAVAEQMVWSAAMVPAVSTGSTVMVTTDEYTGSQEPDVMRRRK